jgi:hypothetical protein
VRVFSLRCGDWSLGGVLAEDEADAKERLVRALGNHMTVNKVPAFERIYGSLTVEEDAAGPY